MSLRSLSLESSLVTCSWAIAQMRAYFPSSSWNCSLIMEAITWYFSHASRWSCSILGCISDIFSVWFPFVWRRYLAFLRSCVAVSSWIPTSVEGSSFSLVYLWGISGVAFDTSMVFTWETGDFLFFPVFVLPNLFFFLGGIPFSGLEGREFSSPFPIPVSTGNN